MVTPEQVWLYLAGEVPMTVCALLAAWLDDGDQTMVDDKGSVVSHENFDDRYPMDDTWLLVTDGTGETIAIHPDYRTHLQRWARSCRDYRTEPGSEMLNAIWCDPLARDWLGLPP